MLWSSHTCLWRSCLSFTSLALLSLYQQYDQRCLLSRECSVPNLSTTRPIQKSLSRQDSQYSEDMDNLMNTKLVSGSNPPGEVHPNPVTKHTVVPGFGSALHLANSGTHGSLVTLDNYGSIAHHRANSIIRLPHPDYTAVDMPIFPSTNAILQGEDRINVWFFFYYLSVFLNNKPLISVLPFLFLIQLTKMPTQSLFQRRRIRTTMMTIREVKEDPGPCLLSAPCLSCPPPTRESDSYTPP